MCSERKDQIFLFAADQLEVAEAEELRRHLATGCPICAGVLGEAEAMLAQVAGEVERVEPSVQTREQLMHRVTEVTPPLRNPIANRRLKIANPLRLFATGILSAAAAIAITSAVFMRALREERARPATLQMVSMASETQPAAHGVVAWDRDHGQWHVAVFNLAPPPSGREFELWFIPSGGKPIPSKTFTVDASGNANIIVPLPANIGPIAVAAITDEPIGGVPQPTGKIQLAGKVPENLKS
jgi:anti-sigma-K factor RskA